MELFLKFRYLISDGKIELRTVEKEKLRKFFKPLDSKKKK